MTLPTELPVARVRELAPGTRRSASPVTAPVPDADILDALTADDRRGALALAMRRHGDAIFHFCCRMVGDAQAPDVQQQVFIDAYKGFDAFDRRSSVKTWLFAIARNRCIDALRKSHRDREHDRASADSLDDVADDRPSSAAVLADSERFAALRHCIDRLAPASRSAVLLRYQEGLAYEEMAAMNSEQAGTIGRRVARAIVTLRTCVERRIGAWT